MSEINNRNNVESDNKWAGLFMRPPETAKIIEYFQANEDDLAELCKVTNGGELDPDELAFYKAHPDKIVELTDKYDKMFPSDEEVAAEGGDEVKQYTEEEIAELSRMTNGETDPEEVA